MATKSFLTSDQEEELQRVFLPSDSAEIGSKKSRLTESAGNDLGKTLGEFLETRLSENESWLRAHPVALGSWARDELCPKSDIDLIFAGSEEVVKKLMLDWQQQGLKIRARVPENNDDWTQGVSLFDVMALLTAKAFTPEGENKLHEQRSLIIKRGAKLRRELLSAMLVERKERAKRYDSVSNYLEPNIKYGPGGLRDLQQALTVSQLFSDHFVESLEPIQALRRHKSFLLAVRQRLHLNGGGDILIASEQSDMASAFGFSDAAKFMREIQNVLTEVSFLADWIVERATSTKKKLEDLEKINFNQVFVAFAALERDPSVLMQGKVRESLPKLFKSLGKGDRRRMGYLINRYLSPEKDEKVIVALFRSQLIEKCIPDLKRVRGLVQHDQYHRYTADAHIIQAVRQLKRFRKGLGGLSALAPLLKELKAEDWRILLWTCLYHDLAKGRGGDHSKKGAELVKKDFTSMGLSLRLTVEVSWMVQNHLVLSTAAFRQNPQAPSTWRALHQKGVAKKRLIRLAVFTAIDIIATNPDAWNQWKEQLLADLVKALRSPRATRFMSLLASANSAKIKLSREFVQGLDPSLVEAISTKFLLKDYNDLRNRKGSLEPAIFKSSKGDLWVRFHERVDRSGLFLSYVNRLHSAGCNIQESSIQTFKSYGVYDWFRVKTSKTPAQLKKLLEIMAEQDLVVPKFEFQQIELVSTDDQEAIVSFRGRNRKGALMAAAHALFVNEMTIKWARVHTWGRQIEDVFCVVNDQDLKQALKKLRKQLVKSTFEEGFGN